MKVMKVMGVMFPRKRYVRSSQTSGTLNFRHSKLIRGYESDESDGSHVSLLPNSILTLQTNSVTGLQVLGSGATPKPKTLCDPLVVLRVSVVILLPVLQSSIRNSSNFLLKY